MRAISGTVRTNLTGRVLQIFFHAIDLHRAIITEGRSAPNCTDGGRPGAAGPRADEQERCGTQPSVRTCSQALRSGFAQGTCARGPGAQIGLGLTEISSNTGEAEATVMIGNIYMLDNIYHNFDF